jgi:hypothetical protein
MPVCPKCGTLLEPGYGLAGGGIGAYMYCPQCMVVVEKIQDAEMEPTKEAEDAYRPNIRVP